jgi:hypothetical protein
MKKTLSHQYDPDSPMCETPIRIPKTRHPIIHFFDSKSHRRYTPPIPPRNAAGSDARVGCEPGQVRKEAALSGPGLVPSCTRSLPRRFFVPVTTYPDRFDILISTVLASPIATTTECLYAIFNSPPAGDRFFLLTSTKIHPHRSPITTTTRPRSLAHHLQALRDSHTCRRLRTDIFPRIRQRPNPRRRQHTWTTRIKQSRHVPRNSNNASRRQRLSALHRSIATSISRSPKCPAQTFDATPKNPTLIPVLVVAICRTRRARKKLTQVSSQTEPCGLRQRAI